MREMYGLMDQMTEWFADVRALSPTTLRTLMGLGSKVAKLVEMKDRLRGPTAESDDGR